MKQEDKVKAFEIQRKSFQAELQTNSGFIEDEEKIRKPVANGGSNSLRESKVGTMVKRNKINMNLHDKNSNNHLHSSQISNSEKKKSPTNKMSIALNTSTRDQPSSHPKFHLDLHKATQSAYQSPTNS